MSFIKKLKNRGIRLKNYLIMQARKNTVIVCVLEKRKLMRGYKVYKRVSLEDNKKIYIFPYNSLGDIYILGLFYKAQNEKFADPFILVVTGNGCLCIAQMMGIKNIDVINARDMRHLAQFATVLQRELPNVEILHFQYPHNSISSGICNMYKLNFLTCYETLVFNQAITKKRIDFDLSMPLTEDEYTKWGLVKGKSVIISPYAKSVPPLPIYFWSTLTARLKKLGFTVITNCNGIHEEPIKGTKRGSFALEKAVAILEFAGFFIGLRSGFCDIVSSAKCRKIIIYPQNSKQYLSSLSHYSLRPLPGARSYKEITYSENPNFISYLILLLADTNQCLEERND
ncbi:hypothetical protein [Enterocloster lavalensis]|uniref:ADP-heptose:LPS heptosyltransferase n=1 Tax=Enterocloster lavalensis TaxID=460384 RepID=A0A1I0HVG1_9FIRM|nr:hypothetical protein [Enterocloster lavalensis]SET88050.1 hypothetical protein SAMN05216313_1189 [Enterocloster lavalensis]